MQRVLKLNFPHSNTPNIKELPDLDIKLEPIPLPLTIFDQNIQYVDRFSGIVPPIGYDSNYHQFIPHFTPWCKKEGFTEQIEAFTITPSAQIELKGIAVTNSFYKDEVAILQYIKVHEYGDLQSNVILEEVFNLQLEGGTPITQIMFSQSAILPAEFPKAIEVKMVYDTLFNGYTENSQQIHRGTDGVEFQFGIVRDSLGAEIAPEQFLMGPIVRFMYLRIGV